jgi:hypothetical protein
MNDAYDGKEIGQSYGNPHTTEDESPDGSGEADHALEEREDVPHGLWSEPACQLLGLEGFDGPEIDIREEVAYPHRSVSSHRRESGQICLPLHKVPGHRRGTHREVRGRARYLMLDFIDRLAQHIPERSFRRVRHCGLFFECQAHGASCQCPSDFSPDEKRRPSPRSWEQRRKAAGDRKPLSCPRCGSDMVFFRLLFGKH